MALLDTRGKRIRALRDDLGLTQVQLADKAGISRPHMNTIEADRVPNISADVLARIASTLGTTTDYLLLLTDDPMAPPEIQPDDLDPEVARLVRLIESLPSHLQDRAVEYLEQQLETFERLFVSERQHSRESS